MENVLEVGTVFKNGGKEFKVLAIRGEIAVVERLNFLFLGDVEYIVITGLIPQENGEYIWCWGNYFYDLDLALERGGFLHEIEYEGITLDDYEDTWYVIDEIRIHGVKYLLLENETYGDEVPCIIVDKYGRVLFDNVCNGFDDLVEELGV